MTDLSSDGLTAGLHVFREPVPLERAGSLAATLGADLCTTLDEADAVVAERQTLPVVDTDTLDALRVLAERVAAADRVARRTHERAVVEVTDRLASLGAGVAVHPSTIRERAAAVQHATVELSQAGQLLEANEVVQIDDLPASPPVEPVASEPSPGADDPAPKRWRGVFAWLRRGRSEKAEDTRESTDLLRSMAAATEEVFGARRASAARADQRAWVLARRDSAAEVLRVAERAWHEVAGEDADPGDVEEVVRRLDPQHQDAVLAAKETVSARAASTLFDNVLARWQAAWADLALDAPAPGEATASVDRLAGQMVKAVVLVGAATERGPDVAEGAPAAPVVMIEALLHDEEED